MPIQTNNLIACGECDALQRDTPLPPHGLALCARCGAELHRDRPASLDHTLAFVAAAAVALLVALGSPLMGLDARGIRSTTTLFETASALHEAGMTSVAILVFLSVIALPVAQTAAMLYLLAPLKLGLVPPGIHLAYRLVNALQPWAMMDVFLVGALVSLIRLTQLADIDAGTGIQAVGAYVLLLACAVGSFEPRAFWARVAALGEPLPAVQQGRSA